MPRIPEIFRLDGQDDRPDGWADQTLDGGHEQIPEATDGPDPWLEALEREAAANQIQGNQEWRCVRCDSDQAVRSGEEQWTCATCYSTDFYATNQALRRQTDRGTWMFLPRPPDGLPGPAPRREPPADGQAGPISRRQRQQHNRALRHGQPHGPPPDGFEMPESEAATFDPTVDPDDLDGAAQQPLPGHGGPTWRPTARPSSCPATPPTTSSRPPTAKAKSSAQRERDKPRVDNKEVMTS